MIRTGTRPVLYSLPDEQPTVTRVEVPTAQGPPVVVTTNTARTGGLQFENLNADDWLVA
jgi:hypothetical protein